MQSANQHASTHLPTHPCAHTHTHTHTQPTILDRFFLGGCEYPTKRLKETTRMHDKAKTASAATSPRATAIVRVSVPGNPGDPKPSDRFSGAKGTGHWTLLLRCLENLGGSQNLRSSPAFPGILALYKDGTFCPPSLSCLNFWSPLSSCDPPNRKLSTTFQKKRSTAANQKAPQEPSRDFVYVRDIVTFSG